MDKFLFPLKKVTIITGYRTVIDRFLYSIWRTLSAFNSSIQNGWSFSSDSLVDCLPALSMEAYLLRDRLFQ
ncbi:hypothetical protein BD410DRAFT_496876 [Rickenella mellea]|uniref:Uncharacterized protein n=1 Tax=Rickenella mellea TaxID=50990 RepID=A0A4Y7PUF4_9AGAM|nr:hypothetical protein BD410DRAFT_496876 [Rickenella mellea]